MSEHTGGSLALAPHGPLCHQGFSNGRPASQPATTATRLLGATAIWVWVGIIMIALSLDASIQSRSKAANTDGCGPVWLCFASTVTSMACATAPVSLKFFFKNSGFAAEPAHGIKRKRPGHARWGLQTQIPHPCYYHINIIILLSYYYYIIIIVFLLNYYIQISHPSYGHVGHAFMLCIPCQCVVAIADVACQHRCGAINNARGNQAIALIFFCSLSVCHVLSPCYHPATAAQPYRRRSLSRFLFRRTTPPKPPLALRRLR